MVKLTGPALGQSASGALAKSVIFSSSKSRSYLKNFKRPKQPRTKPQKAMRAAMSFLSQQWHLISTPYQESWNTIAAAADVSPFNAYMAANLLRFRNGQGLSGSTPPTELGSAASPVSFALAGHVRRLRFTFNITTLNQNWGIYLQHVAGTGIEPTWQDCAHIIATYSTGAYVYDLQPLTAGTYWFTDSRTTYTGAYSRVGRWRSAVVTDA